MMNHAEAARALFHRGYNCAQAVACAFASEMGMEEKEAARMASSFGGGVARLREICGAVSGMALVLGVVKGFDDPADGQAKSDHYAEVQKLAGAFEKRYHSLICRELLQLDRQHDAPQAAPRDAQYYHARPCEEFVAGMAELLEQYFEEETR